MRWGRAWLLALPLTLAACQTPRPQATAAAASPCRDEADRGIGGTGAPAGHARALAERGIGGTGIVGAITGFASVCINGLEVAVDPAVSVTVDGRPDAAAALRVGQVASIAAYGTGADLHADSISVRHAVSGPVLAVSGEGSVLDVAGQPVLLGATTRGARDLRPGEWVAVSGLRDRDDRIHATRLDRGVAGPVSVAGRLARDAGGWHVAGLRLRFAQPSPPAGSPVTLTGRLADGVLYVTGVAAEPESPAGLPGERLLVEAFVATEGARLVLGDNVQATIAASFGAAPPPDQPAVVELHSTQRGLVAVGWHAAPSRGGGATAGRHAQPIGLAAPAVAAPAAATAAPPAAPAPAAAAAPGQCRGTCRRCGRRRGLVRRECCRRRSLVGRCHRQRRERRRRVERGRWRQCRRRRRSGR